jgi:TIR domain-containing protein
LFNEETPFFLSYPRTDAKSGGRGGPRSSDQLVRTFFEELCDEIAPLVHLQYGSDMGFMDVEGLPGGMNWHPELIHALGTCQMLVSLLSAPYLKSEWCGREWHAFTLRNRTTVNGANASVYQGCIIPVLWAPIAFEVPAVIKDHVSIFLPKPTRRDPDLPRLYEQRGIFGLMRAREEEAVSEIVWQLAQLIQKIYYGQRLEPRDFEPQELINIFGRGEYDG